MQNTLSQWCMIRSNNSDSSKDLLCYYTKVNMALYDWLKEVVSTSKMKTLAYYSGGATGLVGPVLTGPLFEVIM